jgi:hypothetical protein
MNAGGRSNATALVVAILVVALIVVIVLWQRDREAKDVEIDIGGAVPAWIRTVA